MANSRPLKLPCEARKYAILAQGEASFFYDSDIDEIVKLFAQHGFSDGLKTVEGLRRELIDGVIFSPRDITPEKLRECASKFTESAPISERLFDPQYYATLSALDPLSRTGYLQEEYSCYFAPRRYDREP